MQHAWVYIVILGLATAFIARIKIKRSPAAVQAPSMQEMEETLEHFAAEMEQENEKLLNAVAVLKQEHAQQMERMNGRIDFLEKQLYDLSQEMKRTSIQNAKLQTELSGLIRESINGRSSVFSEPAASEPSKPASMMQVKERYTELFTLFDQGKSIDFIAKKLGMNKGEVSLIVQLAKQEEQTRV